MKKIRAAVVGYGNIGRFTVEALEAAPDFEIAGIVRRQGAQNKPLELTPYEVVSDIRELKDVQVRLSAKVSTAVPIPAGCSPTASLPVPTHWPLHTRWPLPSRRLAM